MIFRTLLFFCCFLIYSSSLAQELDTLQVFEKDALLSELEASERPWLGFFRNANLTCGIYSLEAGADDQQSPHDTDEIYYVLEGHGKLKCQDKIVEVTPGRILFVPAHAEHRFLEISEKLILLVFFD